MRGFLTLLALAPLAACGPTLVPQPALPPPAVGFTPASKPQPTGVIGADARGLKLLFGEPRLDIRDPTVRKLQFANGQCVLDTYLYPPAPDREPLVTLVEARTSAGADMNWNACVRMLRGQ
ncbi:hypothetical protein [Sphingobium nicotianae]|uniref:Lipoprotein n=1 Tax=Sphingobium nicotianae TaxID=2782607 RepID=A0A9X1DEN2_9SPHN|nr:hypothetical protein [Sphingobium nicotianae]MBT2188540.1 hypothetical protein [Sphingobium nicotianae]